MNNPSFSSGTTVISNNTHASSFSSNSNNISMNASDYPSHPVPEFLLHLHALLTNPALSAILSYLPRPPHGGSIAIYSPSALQSVLHRYYRHSNFASFQRQMNYFGFKKRALHGDGPRGKLEACEFLHPDLTQQAASVLRLQRRTKTKTTNGANKSCAGAGHISGNQEGCAGGMPSSSSSRSICVNEHTNFPLYAAATNLNLYASTPSFYGSFINQPLPFTSLQPYPIVMPTLTMPHPPSAFACSETNNNAINTTTNQDQAAIAAQEAKQLLYQAFLQSQRDLLLHHKYHQEPPVVMKTNYLSSDIHYRDQFEQQQLSEEQHDNANCNPLFSNNNNTSSGAQYQLTQTETTHNNANCNPLSGNNTNTSGRTQYQREQPSILPMNEFFNEDSSNSCSELCDEEELMDADDCSLLSAELGLVG